MEETNLQNNNTSADSEDLELEPSESKEDVSAVQNLETKTSEEAEAEYYQKLTGRQDIKSRADFEKHYQGLKSLVGDQKVAEMRKKAEEFDRLMKEANQIVDEAEKTGELPPLEAEMPEISEVSSLREEFDDMKFLKKNPEAEPFIDIIKAVAKEKGISREEAYQSHLKDLIASKLQTEKSKAEEKSIAVESKSRVALGNQAEISALVEQVRKTDSVDAKQKLVEKFLGLS